ncbi:hypothetical protein [Clostridium sp. JNZ J1-5]|nr:hypothetical protein [Clostridium sp.]
MKIKRVNDKSKKEKRKEIIKHRIKESNKVDDDKAALEDFT